MRKFVTMVLLAAITSVLLVGCTVWGRKEYEGKKVGIILNYKNLPSKDNVGKNILYIDKDIKASISLSPEAKEQFDTELKGIFNKVN